MSHYGSRWNFFFKQTEKDNLKNVCRWLKQKVLKEENEIKERTAERVHFHL